MKLEDFENEYLLPGEGEDVNAILEEVGFVSIDVEEPEEDDIVSKSVLTSEELQQREEENRKKEEEKEKAPKTSANREPLTAEKAVSMLAAFQSMGKFLASYGEDFKSLDDKAKKGVFNKLFEASIEADNSDDLAILLDRSQGIIDEKSIKAAYKKAINNTEDDEKRATLFYQYSELIDLKEIGKYLKTAPDMEVWTLLSRADLFVSYYERDKEGFKDLIQVPLYKNENLDEDTLEEANSVMEKFVIPSDKEENTKSVVEAVKIHKEQVENTKPKETKPKELKEVGKNPPGKQRTFEW